MPLINVRTSISILNANELLKGLSLKMAELTCKPESFVMTSLESNCQMSFSGTTDPCCFIEVKSIGALKPSIMSEVLCKYISQETGIETNRIYIQFEDIKAECWGWDSRTFG